MVYSLWLAEARQRLRALFFSDRRSSPRSKNIRFSFLFRQSRFYFLLTQGLHISTLNFRYNKNKGRFPVRVTFFLISCISVTLCQFAAALSFEESRHLLSRTGFTPTFLEIEALADLSREQAVQQILDSATSPNVLAVPPSITKVKRPPGKGASEKQQRAYREQLQESASELQSWWLKQMITTTTPFSDQMTLFWHNHFVSSLQKVKFPFLMYQQHALLRKNAVGNFEFLVHAISKDPAMTLYLDNQSNRKSAPNENYARELMELFTLGEGHYDEQDIKQAARAFTGWQVDKENGLFNVNQRQHDSGEKTFFGKTGNFDGEDIVDLIFSAKADQVALLITGKLWRHFVSLTNDDTEIARLAHVFEKNNFQLQPLLKAMFLSDSFWAQMDQPNLIKSPVDFVVGTQRAFSLEVTEASLVRQMGRNMGQMLFAPPNVKGWPGGESWITSSTLIARAQLMNQVTRAIEIQGKENSKLMMTPYAHISGYSIAQWQSLLLGKQAFTYELPELPESPPLSMYATELTQMLQDPIYQLK